MKKHAFHTAFVLGALALVWVAATVASTHMLVLLMTVVIGAVYAYGAYELKRFRANTAQLQAALTAPGSAVQDLDTWLAAVPTALRHAVRQRVEGERSALPGPALTPYLVGLLVMLGMLGTFLGMVVTLNGAVFALEGASSVQGMRAAFSEPIKGLGLAFGTSVAGVATSAMLGLMSSLVRRERGQVAQQLDALIGGALRTHSLAYQRLETFRALQQQSQALPQVVAQLQTLMTQMERHSQQLGDRLLSHQVQFHAEVKTTYQDLAQSVDQSLRTSLSQSMQLASDSIRPVVQSTLSEMATQATALHERVADTTRQQLQTLLTQFDQHAQGVASGWTTALAEHERNNQRLQEGLAQTLAHFGQTFDERTQSLLTSVAQNQAQSQASQTSADQQRLQAWQNTLQDMANTLQAGWQTVGDQTLAQQQRICDNFSQSAQALGQQTQTQTQQLFDSLNQAATQWRSDAQAHAQQTLDGIERLMASNEALVRARTDTEAQWAQQHAQSSEALATLLRHELGQLRAQEAARGDAAVARLAELQTVVTEHLRTLGTALEAPIGRLIETASEAPKAAAEVIGQLRHEISVSVARDNALLEERTRILETLSTLLDAIGHASSEQRSVIDALVTSSQHTLTQATQSFQSQLALETGKLEGIAAEVTASAVDVASLGETFGFAVRAFSESNDKLMDSLQRIESALSQSMTRSDEQLAYYVAQAREIIDLSIGSQKDVLEALQQRQTREAV